MKFKDIVEELAEQRYCTRAQWEGRLVVAFGMDNVLQLWDSSHISSNNPTKFHVCLADVRATDWVALPAWWGPRPEGSQEELYMSPFESEKLNQYLEGLKP